MAFNLGAITATMGMDASGYTRGVLAAQGLTQAFGTTFSTFLANPVAGGILLMRRFGSAAVATLRRVGEESESIVRLADQTGVAVETIEALRRQMNLATGDTAQADLAVTNFATRLGDAASQGGRMADEFARLGIVPAQVRDVDEAFRQATRAIANMEDATARNSIAAQVFGRRAGPVISQAVRDAEGDVDELVRRFELLGTVMGRTAREEGAQLNTTLGLLDDALTGLRQQAVLAFFQGLTGEIEISDEQVRQLAQSLRDDLVPIVQQVGEAAAILLPTLREIARLIGPIMEFFAELRSSTESGVYLLQGGALRGLLGEAGGPFGDLSPADQLAVTRAALRASRRAGQ